MYDFYTPYTLNITKHSKYTCKTGHESRISKSYFAELLSLELLTGKMTFHTWLTTIFDLRSFVQQGLDAACGLGDPATRWRQSQEDTAPVPTEAEVDVVSPSRYQLPDASPIHPSEKSIFA